MHAFFRLLCIIFISTFNKTFVRFSFYFPFLCKSLNIKIDIAVKLDLLWKFLKPISFALIGKEVDFIKLDGKVVGFGIAILFMGCVVSSWIFLSLSLSLSELIRRFILLFIRVNLLITQNRSVNGYKYASEAKYTRM